MEFEVFINPRARQDLSDIWTYIAKDDAVSASSFCQRLTQRALDLRAFPRQGTLFRSRTGVWKTPFPPYLIFYKVDEANRTVEILRFWHAAQSRNRLRLKEETPLYAGVASA